MSTLRDKIIKLGKTNPELRRHLGPILKAHDQKTASPYDEDRELEPREIDRILRAAATYFKGKYGMKAEIDEGDEPELVLWASGYEDGSTLSLAFEYDEWVVRAGEGRAMLHAAYSKDTSAQTLIAKMVAAAKRAAPSLLVR